MTEAADLREALLDQLAYLIDEIEALKAVIDRVPVPLLEARPPNGEPSLKQTYGLLATLDEEVYLPRLQQMMAPDEPAFDSDVRVPQRRRARCGRRNGFERRFRELVPAAVSEVRAVVARPRAAQRAPFIRSSRGPLERSRAAVAGAVQG